MPLLDESARGVKRAIHDVSLQMWEDDVFKDIGGHVPQVSLRKDILPSETDLVSLTQALMEKFSVLMESFPEPKPSGEYRRSLLVVALHLDSGVNWDARSDILTTRLLGTLFGESLRAHADGVYHYSNGAWIRVEEIPEPVLRSMEIVLTRSQCLYKHLMSLDVVREWLPVFDALKDFQPDDVPKPCCDFEFDECFFFLIDECVR